MKKQLLFILSLFVVGTLAAQTASIPDGDFETWDSVIWNEPMGFTQTSNSGMNIPIGAPANVTQTAPFHGTYGIQLSTIKFGADTLFAYVTNSINNPVQGQGGIPYSQQATGVRFYYKCNTMSIGKDTACVLFVFKNSGSIIGTYLYKLYGTVGSFTLDAQTFSPALPMAPDSVIFAAISSIGALQGNSGLPGTTLDLDSITFTGVASQPAMMNGDFENWTPDSMYTPVGWFVSTTGSARTTDKYTGQYAMQLTTGIPPQNGGQVQQAFATTGKEVHQNNHHDTLEGGYPYSMKTDSLIFYYKYDTAAYGDTANVGLQFNKGGHVFFFTGSPITESPVYKRMSVPFNLPSNPDSVIINFESSQNNSGNVNPKFVGSSLKIDSLHFGSQPIVTGINPISTGSVSLYPNPTNGVFYINMQGLSGKVEKVTIYDMSGRILENRIYTFGGLKNNIEEFDMSSYSTGVYVIQINTTQGIKYQKVSKL